MAASPQRSPFTSADDTAETPEQAGCSADSKEKEIIVIKDDDDTSSSDSEAIDISDLHFGRRSQPLRYSRATRYHLLLEVALERKRQKEEDCRTLKAPCKEKVQEKPDATKERASQGSRKSCSAKKDKGGGSACALLYTTDPFASSSEESDGDWEPLAVYGEAARRRLRSRHSETESDSNAETDGEEWGDDSSGDDKTGAEASGGKGATSAAKEVNADAEAPVVAASEENGAAEMGSGGWRGDRKNQAGGREAAKEGSRETGAYRHAQEEAGAAIQATPRGRGARGGRGRKGGEGEAEETDVASAQKIPRRVLVRKVSKAEGYAQGNSAEDGLAAAEFGCSPKQGSSHLKAKRVHPISSSRSTSAGDAHESTMQEKSKHEATEERKQRRKGEAPERSRTARAKAALAELEEAAV
ncbi:uncharacterized protein LOC34622287 [Cyclospora cayetanensis]|uniref:Uncharacterized protein n=2 Tax=Cyclospora cayetanensis TaxID=88456 RepID=A0A1D3CXL8_9EIME|nr:uncharacterized protein LOC34622287 [Cyclospora cayetanensis]OEH75934.1 hypothetical protein cyc_06032 [Cyclospora cayetanensis]